MTRPNQSTLCLKRRRNRSYLRVRSPLTLKLHRRDAPCVLSCPVQSEQIQLTPRAAQPLDRLQKLVRSLVAALTSQLTEALCAFSKETCRYLESFCRKNKLSEKFCPQNRFYLHFLSFYKTFLSKRLSWNCVFFVFFCVGLFLLSARFVLFCVFCVSLCFLFLLSTRFVLFCVFVCAFCVFLSLLSGLFSVRVLSGPGGFCQGSVGILFFLSGRLSRNFFSAT